MEQQASLYQIQYIPQTSGTITPANGGNAQILVPQGVISGDSMIECRFTLIAGVNAGYVVQRREFWPFLTQTTCVIDGTQVLQSINQASCQYSYYQRFLKDQKDVFANPANQTTLGKKQWNILGQGAGANAAVFSCCMRLDHFLGGAAFSEVGGKLRIYNQMTINFQIRPVLAGDFATLANIGGLVVPAANAITTMDFQLYGKIYIADPHVDQVFTKVQQQYFGSATTVNCNFSVGANQISQYQALMVKEVAGNGNANNTAISFEEPGAVSAYNFQRNGYNLFNTQNSAVAGLTTQQIGQIFGMISDDQNLATGVPSCTFGIVYQNSIVNHVLNVSGPAQDFYFTYQIKEARQQ